jgi:hypothetical protein
MVATETFVLGWLLIVGTLFLFFSFFHVVSLFLLLAFVTYLGQVTCRFGKPDVILGIYRRTTTKKVIRLLRFVPLQGYRARTWIMPTVPANCLTGMQNPVSTTTHTFLTFAPVPFQIVFNLDHVGCHVFSRRHWQSLSNSTNGAAFPVP